MALITLKQLLDEAEKHGFAMPAFNINNIEQANAIMMAAEKLNSAVILQVSQGARKYMGGAFLKGVGDAVLKTWPHLPVCIHQDHGSSVEVCQNAIDTGFSSVMMDGSLEEDMKTPSDFRYNVEITSEVVAIAHRSGVSVEGELGCLGQLETGLAPEEDGSGAEGVLSHQQMLTDPDQAQVFVQKTGVDALAIAIGTSHGAYKFTTPPTEKTLDLLRIKAIKEKIPDTHLVMHGASSVPKELIDTINQFGGLIPETYGTPVDKIIEAIGYGISKVNIDTDLRLAATGAIRKYLFEHPDHFDPRQYMKVAIEAMKEICMQRFLAFGTEGSASKIKVKTLQEMALFYAQQGKRG